MPLCYIFTNLKDSEISEDLEERLEECIAKILNKPKEGRNFHRKQHNITIELTDLPAHMALNGAALK
ncbi:uncharacterized protein LOC123534640 [Mercenaria mercenaria]|uniref:uncharacterized protein LOC123534640 n=1 Tax=Mercenaria mercenaria TaxID=6596 RepID=UPI00234F6B82|nr:uncharacterized protein LOC123534640 [Mercenaria mercenaria]